MGIYWEYIENIVGIYTGLIGLYMVHMFNGLFSLGESRVENPFIALFSKKTKYHFFVYISLPKSRMCGCEQLRLLVLGNNNNIDDKIHSLIENYRAYTRKLENTNFGEQGVIGLIFWYDEHDWIGQIVRIWTSLGGKSFHFIPMIKQQKKCRYFTRKDTTRSDSRCFSSESESCFYGFWAEIFPKCFCQSAHLPTLSESISMGGQTSITPANLLMWVIWPIPIPIESARPIWSCWMST